MATESPARSATWKSRPPTSQSPRTSTVASLAGRPAPAATEPSLSMTASAR